MSKASEWAYTAADLIARQADLDERWGEKPRFKVEGQVVAGGGFYVPGEVTAQGRLQTHSAMLTSREALAFARWINDTFGEPGA